MRDNKAIPPKRRDPASNGRGSVAALVAVALLVAVVFWGIQAIVHHNGVQNCLDAGRRDCTAVP